jgi:hypothetical protein
MSICFHEPLFELVNTDEWLKWLVDLRTRGRIRYFGLALTIDRLLPFLEAKSPLADFVQTVDSLQDREADVLERFRCLGGTSTRWGGVLIPFLEGDLDPEQWPIPYQDIVRFVPCVEAQFGLSPGPYTLDELGGFASSDFVPRLVKWPVFAKQGAFCAALSDLCTLGVWLNATVTHFEVNDERIIRLTACSPDGGKAVVEADEVIFAAGAIETTRLLLLLDHAGPAERYQHFRSRRPTWALFQQSSVRYRRAPRSTGSDRAESPGGFSVRTAGCDAQFAVRNRRRQRTTQIDTAMFFHIAFETDEKSGFNALRNLFRFVQQRRLPPPSMLFNLAMGGPWLAKAV